MSNLILQIFDVNTDAVATNRGFYYQYLHVLEKWLRHYIHDENISTLTEVDNDIKEVGSSLIFTQVKCYSTNFSFNSVEIQDSLFHFYLLFLKYEHDSTLFCFSTNTSITKSDKLLAKWCADNSLTDENLQLDCINKVKEILIDAIKKRKNKKLEQLAKSTAEIKREEIKNAFDNFKKELEKPSFKSFVKSIRWEFDQVSPEIAIQALHETIYSFLKHPKFGNRPPSLLANVFLSEIYQRSQKENKDERCVNNPLIEKILEHTDDSLHQFVNYKFTKLWSIELDLLKVEVEQKFKEIQSIQQKQHIAISALENLKKTAIPKALNLLPDLYSHEVYDWEDFLKKVAHDLKNKKNIAIYAEGGMGKSAFGKKYLKQYKAIYDHIIWIDADDSIANAFIFNELIHKNLNITVSAQDDKQQKFQSILNEIHKIEGNNLMVIDIQQVEGDIVALKQIAALSNWEKLILTRSHLKQIPALKLPRICFETAKILFLSYCNKETISDELFETFFEYIDYNVLVIELTAKTIEYSIDLTLNTLFTGLKEQFMDNYEFNIDIEIHSEHDSIRIFDFLIKKFSFDKLSNNDKYYIEFLSLLPSKNIVIDDLIAIWGIEHYDKNKIEIGNILLSLEKQGLIEYTLDRKGINIHKIIQEVVIYNARKEFNPFVGQIFHIAGLTAKIAEANHNPYKSFKFLRYAESLLNSIKEKYRHRCYQPLLILENEVLFSYRFFMNTKANHDKWIRLVDRAEKYQLSKKFAKISTSEAHLLNDKTNLGTMYNNLGLSYADNKDDGNALIYYEKALKILKTDELKCKKTILLVLSNITKIYLRSYNLVNAISSLKNAYHFRKKYNFYEDDTISIEFVSYAESYMMIGNYNKAIKLLTAGISFHNSLDVAKRNDFYLALYHYHLSRLYILNEQFENTLIQLNLSIQILEDMNLKNSEQLLSIYEFALKFYQVRALEEETIKVMNKIKAIRQ
jgi:hypothetical protein